MKEMKFCLLNEVQKIPTCNTWSIRLLEATAPFSWTHHTILVRVTSVDEWFDALFVLRGEEKKKKWEQNLLWWNFVLMSFVNSHLIVFQIVELL